ncbi:MAG: hypothetical protein AAF363_03730 [Bacteroidota bacterium]
MQNSVAELYKDYTQERKIDLSPEQFASFLAFYPALLVASSDGIVDKEEWLYCKKLASGLGNSFSRDDSEEDHENLTLIYRYEFRYLLKNQEIWEERFLKVVKEYLSENSYAKEFVNETIYLFADASNGISQEEMDTINCLEIKLDLK